MIKLTLRTAKEAARLLTLTEKALTPADMAAAAIARAENFIFVGDCLNSNREDNEGEGMTTDFVPGWLGSATTHGRVAS
jgi:hypothetical protein